MLTSPCKEYMAAYLEKALTGAAVSRLNGDVNGSNRAPSLALSYMEKPCVGGRRACKTKWSLSASMNQCTCMYVYECKYVST